MVSVGETVLFLDLQLNAWVTATINTLYDDGSVSVTSNGVNSGKVPMDRIRFNKWGIVPTIIKGSGS